MTKTPLAPRSFWTLLCALLICMSSPALAQDREIPTIDLASEKVVDTVVLGGIGDRGTPRLMDVAVGDVNGDQIEDLLFGAPAADPNGRISAGSVYLVLGKSGLVRNRTVDPTLNDHWDLRFDGALTGAQLGFRLDLVDYDGDGLDDIVMTAPGEGAVYVVLGKQKFENEVVLLDNEDAWDLVIRAQHDDSLLGASLCTGDLDSDDRAELVFSALHYNDAGQLTSTDLYIIPGRPDWRDKVEQLNGRIPGRVRLVRYASGNTRLVHRCAVGDLEGDNAGDLVAAMPLDMVGDMRDAGTVAVVLDVMAGETMVELGAEGPPWGFRILGDQAGARFGSAVQVHDVNGDNLDDLVVGAPGRLIEGPESEGAVYVFLGGLLPSGSETQAANTTIIGDGGEFGRELAALDVNGDNRRDVVVGAPGANTWAGKKSGSVDIYLSGPQLTAPDTAADSPLRDLRLVGSPGDRIGYAMAAGDLDGDEKQDLVLRSTNNSQPNRVEAGSLFVVPEPMTVGREGLIDDMAHMTILGPGSGGGLSRRVLQEDLDGDGITELVFLSPGGYESGGVACVVHSGIQGRLDLNTESACDLRIIGPPGSPLADIDFGDFDGDGNMDVALGAPEFKSGDEVGLVAVLPLPSDLTGEVRAQAGAKDGGLIWLGTAGAGGLGSAVRLEDLDLDGKDELIAASRTAAYDDRESAGVVLVFPGQSGLSSSKARMSDDIDTLGWRFEGLSGGALGSSIEVLRFDGNELPDLVVVAQYATTSTHQAAGSAWVIYDVGATGKQTWTVSDPDLSTLKLNGPGDAAGLVVEHAEDVDRDGLDDLLLVSPNRRVSPQEYGSVHLLRGQKKAETGVRELSGELMGGLVVEPPRNQQISSASLGDVNGNGISELLVSTMPIRSGADHMVYVIDLRDVSLGLVDLNRAEATRAIFLAGRSAGGVMVAPELSDGDGDGRDDIWLVAPYADDRAADQGKAYRISTDKTVAVDEP